MNRSSKRKVTKTALKLMEHLIQGVLKDVNSHTYRVHSYDWAQRKGMVPGTRLVKGWAYAEFFLSFFI